MQDLSQCPFCGGHLERFWAACSFSRCVECDLFIRSPFPSESELDDLYKTKWLSPEANDSETGNMDEFLARQYVRELAKTLQRKDLSGLRILDFGAGKGALLDALIDSGAIAYGVEPYGCTELATTGRLVFHDLADSPPELRFDGIVCMDVVEHLLAPWETFRHLLDRLNPGGWLLVSTPNPKGLTARLMGCKWREVAKAGHIMFLSQAVMKRMLQVAGFSVVKPARWHVRFAGGLPKYYCQLLTLAFGLHGAARVIAFK
jgi:SAM-dependent methyltransferase